MIRDCIRKIIQIDGAIIEQPENTSFGDYSTNAVLKMAKKEGRDPMEMARAMAQKLASVKDPMFAKIEAAEPGFINFTLSMNFLAGQVVEILNKKETYGVSDFGEKKKVQVEFISANPTGPLTLGNGRGGFYGDVLANVLSRAGYQVQRAYYINDAGYQVEVLGHSVLKDEQAQYKGDYVDLLNKKFTGFLKSQDTKIVGQRAAKYILKNLIQPTSEQRMKIRFNEWVSEKAIRESGQADEVFKILKAKNLTYEEGGAVWFKSTQFGDDKDRVLITSAKEDREQSATYILPDAAYHYKKFNEDKFDKVINIWGADHHGYVARLQAAGKALAAWDEKKLEIIIMQLVRLFANGQEVKMSKRLGTYITLDELLAEIPLDVARFFFLMRAANTHMDFDLDLAKEQSDKNPVYYVQYAHARICSILRKSSESSSSPLGEAGRDLNLLFHPSELALIKQLIRLPEIIVDTAKDYQVHRLPQYALDLVRSFHKFYEDCRVIDETNKDLTQARLALCAATRIVLKNTLDLMGLSAPEKM